MYACECWGRRKIHPLQSGIRAALAFMSDNGILIQARRLCAARMRLDLGHLICSKMNFHFLDCTLGEMKVEKLNVSF
jgi:hypothetical protein